eukprot:1149738-Pelagomonas_calceolata.AAC.3
MALADAGSAQGSAGPNAEWPMLMLGSGKRSAVQDNFSSSCAAKIEFAAKFDRGGQLPSGPVPLEMLFFFFKSQIYPCQPFSFKKHCIHQTKMKIEVP